MSSTPEHPIYDGSDDENEATSGSANSLVVEQVETVSNSSRVGSASKTSFGVVNDPSDACRPLTGIAQGLSVLARRHEVNMS